MRVNLEKIEKFYTTSVGQYAHNTVLPIIDNFLSGAGETQKTCIASAAAFPYMEQMKNMKRLSLQSFHDQDVWPESGKGHYILADRTHWPYRAEEADFVVLIHDVEFAEDADHYLREAWRVLKGEGRLVIIIPNRSGKWARYDNTPFGLGYPYTLEQMSKLLASAHFAIDRVAPALYHPPTLPESFVGEAYRSIIEKIGGYCLFQSGIYAICASKHIYAPSSKGLGATAAQKAKQALFPKPTAVNQRDPF